MAVAVAAAAAAVDRKKSVFRKALTALRYAVAAAVTVVVVMTAVYAFHVVARTDDLIIGVVNGYISVDPENQPDPKLSFTLSVDNPSGRVRLYYTGIQCELKVNDSRIQPSKFVFPDMVVAPHSVLDVDTEANFTSTRNLTIDIFRRENRTLTGNLTLKGNLTVGVFSTHNKTSVPTTYYCRWVPVGNVGGSGDTWSSCLTADEDTENNNGYTATRYRRARIK